MNSKTMCQISRENSGTGGHLRGAGTGGHWQGADTGGHLRGAGSGERTGAENSEGRALSMSSRIIAGGGTYFARATTKFPANGGLISRERRAWVNRERRRDLP